MLSGRLVLNNFDARIPKIEIKPKCSSTKIIISSKWYNEKDELIKGKIQFDEVAAVEFSINYFDNFIGAEGCGLYEVKNIDFIEAVVSRNFERRREVYLLEGDYNYVPDEPEDMLNTFDIAGYYEYNKAELHAYVQNVDAGVYIIIAKRFEVII